MESLNLMQQVECSLFSSLFSPQLLTAQLKNNVIFQHSLQSDPSDDQKNHDHHHDDYSSTCFNSQTPHLHSALQVQVPPPCPQIPLSTLHPTRQFSVPNGYNSDHGHFVLSQFSHSFPMQSPNPSQMVDANNLFNRPTNFQQFICVEAFATPRQSTADNRLRRMQLRRHKRMAQIRSCVVKGPWTPDEDRMLVQLVAEYGVRNWAKIANVLGGRAGKQCRERWHNHLRPNIRKDEWTKEEDMLLIEAHREMGNKWAEIAKRLPGRSENTIKNRYNATKRKRHRRMLAGDGSDNSPLLLYIKAMDSSSSTTVDNDLDPCHLMCSPKVVDLKGTFQASMLTKTDDSHDDGIESSLVNGRLFTENCYNFGFMFGGTPAEGQKVVGLEGSQTCEPSQVHDVSEVGGEVGNKQGRLKIPVEIGDFLVEKEEATEVKMKMQAGGAMHGEGEANFYDFDNGKKAND